LLFLKEKIKMLEIIIKVIIGILSALATGIPALIALKKAWSARKKAEADAEAAKSEAEKAEAERAKEAANADLLATAKGFIAAAEVAFDGFDKMMKAQNSSAGAMKKDNVFTKLQAYALQNGYEFDAAEWNEKIDELVKFTKSVNVKKNP
jgi:hypothetical protein